MKAQPLKASNPIVLKTKESFWSQILNKKYLILMSLPFVIWVFVFSYIPIWGWTMAFQNYKPGLPFSQQEWVGLQNFKQLFLDHDFYLVMRNTLAMSIMGLVVGFICPIVLAVL